MRLVLLLACAAALAGCTGSADGQEEGQAAAPAPAASASGIVASPSPQPTETGLAARDAAGARSVSEETDDYLFTYSYPTKAGAIPALGDWLDGELEERRSELAREAAQARREARADGFPYNKHSYQAEWKVVADIPGWLSMSNEFSTYSGGAHGIYGVNSLLWDKSANEAMDAIQLFASAKALEDALGDRFCDGLDKAREARRGTPVDRDADDPFNDCPGIDELTVLVGSGGGRRFDRLTLYAGPYVAGPYAEGDFRVNLPVDQAVMDAVKPRYRDSFAARNRA
ncbi:DUF4163 domain-containing protein [Croceibacterium sp. TMG7-5b_MA50]|uniref:DUF4163 domain-containing protein n=1 Tax=Croceibacterium sp. TMG7-5b_MA50 TaxID=3121290 RepID=UPI003221FD70